MLTMMLLIDEGNTQGDPLAMPLYALASVLIELTCIIISHATTYQIKAQISNQPFLKT